MQKIFAQDFIWERIQQLSTDRRTHIEMSQKKQLKMTLSRGPQPVKKYEKTSEKRGKN